jgi:hypothetical protein
MAKKMTTSSEMLLNSSDPTERGILLQEREFSIQQRKATALSRSSVIPADYQDNVANCLVAMEMSERLGLGTLEIMQNLLIVHGKPTFYSKYLIARINGSGLLKGGLDFEFIGERDSDSWGCYAVGIDAQTGKEKKGMTVTMTLAKKEGWYSRKGSKWQTMPEQMLIYRAASFWYNAFAPHLLMGVQTNDSIEDTTPERDITPKPSALEMLNDKEPLDCNLEAPENQEKMVEVFLEKIMKEQDGSARRNIYGTAMAALDDEHSAVFFNRYKELSFEEVAEEAEVSK